MTSSRIRSRLQALATTQARRHPPQMRYKTLECIDGVYYDNPPDPAHPYRLVDPAIDRPLPEAELQALEADPGISLTIIDWSSAPTERPGYKVVTWPDGGEDE